VRGGGQVRSGRVNVTNVTWRSPGPLSCGNVVTSVMSPHVTEVTSTRRGGDVSDIR
jgi:hypothetical protein